MSEYLSVENLSCIPLKSIPELDYPEFVRGMSELLSVDHHHCLHYFGLPHADGFRCIALVADDRKQQIHILSHFISGNTRIIPSLTPQIPALHIFEREIHEQFGIVFEGHPWMKPVRFPFDRADLLSGMDEYPFYRIDSHDLHEVGVGPVHAGIIEPGHFRFICQGEKVLHLEIHLGYQHRGWEYLMLNKSLLNQQSVLAESVAGDTAMGHAVAFSALVETFARTGVADSLQKERFIALEMERIAMHIADTAALCTDTAYQLGQVACEALRTLVINGLQLWSGNRFGKGLVRPGGTYYPLNRETASSLMKILGEVEERYTTTADRIFSLPSVLDRFETIGQLSKKQVSRIGAVGMAARMAGLKRDIRWSHPVGHYRHIAHEPVVLESGDVLARALMRRMEVIQSLEMVKKVLHDHRETASSEPLAQVKMTPNSLGISLTEGWRGEICHTAINDAQGRFTTYKVKDPSMHNWMALALAVRNQEISDFPLCNKSFNLSYCGHDL